jgi:hypothetical protein
VPARLQAELEAPNALIGVIARTEMGVHHRFTDFFDKVEARQMVDDDSHCCCCAAMI